MRYLPTLVVLTTLCSPSCSTSGEPFRFDAVWDLTPGVTTLADAQLAFGRGPNTSNRSSSEFEEELAPGLSEFEWSRGSSEFAVMTDFERVLLRFDSSGVLVEPVQFVRLDPDRKPMRMSVERVVALNDSFSELTTDLAALKQSWGLWDLPPDGSNRLPSQLPPQLSHWPRAGTMVDWSSNGLHGSAATLSVFFDSEGQPHSFEVQYAADNYNTGAPEVEVLQGLVQERASLRTALERVDLRPVSLARLENGEVRILWQSGLLYSDRKSYVLILDSNDECQRVISPRSAWGNPLFIEE